MSVNVVQHTSTSAAQIAAQEIAKSYPLRQRTQQVADVAAVTGYLPDESIFGVVFTRNEFRVHIEAVIASGLKEADLQQVEYYALHLSDHILRRTQEGGTPLRTGPEEQAVPVEPDRAYEYRIDLVATSNVFLPGHRVALYVTSSSFPRFDRNAGTGAPLGEDTEESLRKARQSVFHDADRPSHLVLPVVLR